MVQFEARWRLAFLCAAGLVLLVPLRDSNGATAEAQFNNAQLLFLRGQLEKCQRQAEQGYIRNRTDDPEWAAKFQLLEAQVLERRGMSDDALNLLHEFHSPTDNQQEEIRKLVLESVALTRQQQLSSAAQKLSQAEKLCKGLLNVACGEMMRSRGDLAAAMGKAA